MKIYGGQESHPQNLVGEGYGSNADDDLDAADLAAAEVSSGSAEIDAGLLVPAVTATQQNQVDDG